MTDKIIVRNIGCSKYYRMLIMCRLKKMRCCPTWQHKISRVIIKIMWSHKVIYTVDERDGGFPISNNNLFFLDRDTHSNTDHNQDLGHPMYIKNSSHDPYYH